MKTVTFQPERLKMLGEHLTYTKVRLDEYEIDNPARLIEHDQFVEQRIPLFIAPLIEAAEVFPEEWLIDDNGLSFWIYDPQTTTVSSAMLFFGLTFNMFMHLFVPGSQNTGVYGGRMLSNKTKAKDIGFNMLDMCRMLEVVKN